MESESLLPFGFLEFTDWSGLKGLNIREISVIASLWAVLLPLTRELLCLILMGV